MAFGAGEQDRHSRRIRLPGDGGIRPTSCPAREQFFELAGTLTVEVEFIVTDEESKQLLAAKVRLFYAHIPAHFNVICPDCDDPPAPG
jgi:hypothetical protein